MLRVVAHGHQYRDRAGLPGHARTFHRPELLELRTELEQLWTVERPRVTRKASTITILMPMRDDAEHTLYAPRDVHADPQRGSRHSASCKEELHHAGRREKTPYGARAALDGGTSSRDARSRGRSRARR